MIGQTDFLQALGWAVLNSLWQLALLWVFYQGVTGIFKSAKSSFRSSLAFLFLLSGFAWFLYTFISAYNNHTVLISSVFGNEGNHQLNTWLQKTLPIASVLYLILLTFPIAHFIRNYRYVQVIRQYGLSKLDVQWRVFINKVAAQMGIRKQVRIWVSEFVSSPVTIGFLKPVILVPLAAINHLSASQMEAVLLHELSHIRRYDYLINLIINFIQTILYFNPFVKAFVKIVEREREKSCDEMVLQFQYDSYEYATALLTLEKTNHKYKPLAIAAAGKKNDLLHRIELILGVKKKNVLSFNKLAGLLAGLLCIIALNSLLIISKPLHADKNGLFTNLSSPFNFLTGNFSEPATKPIPVKESPVVKENQSQVVNQVVKQVKEQSEIIVGVQHTATVSLTPGVINVKYEPVEIHKLKKYEEAQVKAVMDASKKVLENAEWKALEKNIAEVLTQQQKEELKATYEKELNKVDWNSWENKLRIAYDKVDWSRVNDQLAKAVNAIRVDSLQRAYNDVICKLDDVQKELSLNNLDGIPDTDITLKAVEETKQQAQKTLNKLRGIRNKKIIHL